MVRKARVGIIGAGYWGKNLVRNFHSLGALAAICDISASVRDEFAKSYPSAEIFADMTPMLEGGRTSAVAIATPASTHAAIVERALRAGLHVFCEKPLSLVVDEAAALGAAARRRGLVLMVGHLLLYHPAFRALMATMQRGELGRLRYIYSLRLSLGKIRREENALWSFAPHDVSMILALTGLEPDSVAASGGHYLSEQVADTTLSQLAFPDGVQAHIFVSWLHPYKDHRLVVVGDRAMAAFNDTAAGPQKLLLYRHNVGWDGEIPVVDKADAEPIPYDAAEPLRVECQAFLDAVTNGAPPPSDPDESVRVLRVLDACQRSIATGTRVALNAGADDR